MATKTLSALDLIEDPQFPQFFSGAIDRMIGRVDRVFAENLFFSCSYESPESAKGLGDGGYPCLHEGVVHDLVNEQPYCALHFFRTQLKSELAMLAMGGQA